MHTPRSYESCNSPHLLAITTLAPSEERFLAISLPKPVPPPVMKATLPLKLPGGSMGSSTAVVVPLLHLHSREGPSLPLLSLEAEKMSENLDIITLVPILIVLLHMRSADLIEL